MVNNLVIHAETAEEEGVKVYEGNSLAEADKFISKLKDVTVIQCALHKELNNGEGRSMNRKEKGEAAEALVKDIKSWLEENAESTTNK